MKKILLNIGDIVVSTEPAMLETALGSCVSTCLWDEELKIGGMNHFMLPKAMDGAIKDSYCGRESIEKLINIFLSLNCDVRNIKAKIFGGGRIIKSSGNMLDVGRENVIMAKQVLNKYGIPILNEFIQPDYGIKIFFYSATGKTFVKKMNEME